MESISADLQQAEQYKAENELKFRLQERQKLPVFAYRQEILEQIKQHNVILIRGATGCGKTTQVIDDRLFSLLSNVDFRFLNISSMTPLNTIKALTVTLSSLNLVE